MTRQKATHGVGIARVAAQILLCAGLAGCGLSDQFSFMPAVLRYPASAPTTQAYPDIMALAKTQGRSLFAHGPNRIEISTLLYSEQTKIYTACARVNDGSQHPLMLAMVASSGFYARRRAEANDGCAGQEFFVVNVD
jgi:hypothetical protein